MRFPNGAIIPLYIASFVMLAFQYYRINPLKRLLNLRFGLMASTVVLLFATVFLESYSLSPVFFLLALFSLGLAIYLFRHMPPPGH